MLKKLSLIFILICFFSCNKNVSEASNGIYKKISILNIKSDSLTIKDVIQLQKKGGFTISLENKVFHRLEKQEATWLHFKVDDFNEDLYFSFWGAFLEEGIVYLSYNDSINKLNSLSLKDSKNYYSKYRFPTWKLPRTNHPTDIFVRIKDSKRITSLKLLLFNSDEFINFTQKDSTIIGVTIAFLLTLLLALILLFIAKRQYSLLWYAAYILVFSFDFLTNHGIDLQLKIFSTPVEHSIKRLLFQCIGAVFALVFYIKFYPYNKSTSYIKQIFKFTALFYLISAIILASFILVDNIYFPKIYLWLPQRLLMIVVIMLHFVLIKKKVLPFYLGIAFLIPLLVYSRFLYINPKLDLSLTEYFILDNMFYFSLITEMSLIVFYIISQLVKSEFLAINLQKENLELRNNFQNNIAEVEQKERNKLLSNVHDSFGGYLETLKLRLLSKSENTPEKVQEVLDAFYKEYRYLLNSLYSPKINSENFAENLIEFFEKLNQLTNNTIKHQFSIENTELPPEKCMHLYRIISELTTNAIKYAKASEIQVKIKKSDTNLITLDVSDNGIGFDIDTVNQNSYGLKNIKTRVNAMKGKIDIKSIKNQGTHIVITIPYNE